MNGKMYQDHVIKIKTLGKTKNHPQIMGNQSTCSSMQGDHKTLDRKSRNIEELSYRSRYSIVKTILKTI